MLACVLFVSMNLASLKARLTNTNQCLVCCVSPGEVLAPHETVKNSSAAVNSVMYSGRFVHLLFDALLPSRIRLCTRTDFRSYVDGIRCLQRTLCSCSFFLSSFSIETTPIRPEITHTHTHTHERKCCKLYSHRILESRWNMCDEYVMIKKQADDQIEWISIHICSFAC